MVTTVAKCGTGAAGGGTWLRAALRANLAARPSGCRCEGVVFSTMKGGLGLWVAVFAASAGALVAFAAALTRTADELGERTVLGRVFAGAVVMALITSAPELVADVAAARAGAPNLALGDLLGSSLANMAILAGVDLVHRGRVRAAAGLEHARVASGAIALTGLATIGLVQPWPLPGGWLGLDTVVLAGAYLALLAWLRRRPPRVGPATAAPRVRRAPARTAGTSPLLVRLVWSGAGVVASAPWVTISAREIGRELGIAETIVGVVLLAVTTSAPELVTSLAAVRIGAHDLAVGNLFGSNAANMALFVVVDATYTRGPLFEAADPAQVVAGAGAVLLMALALGSILSGTERRVGWFEPDALVLLGVYVAVVGIVWRAAGAG